MMKRQILTRSAYTAWMASLLVQCAGDDTMSPDTMGATDGMSSSDSQTSTTVSTDGATTGEALSCDQATTEEECAMAVSRPFGPMPCTWFPHFTLTTDGTTCSFEASGGSCAEYWEGDTDCGTHGAACDLEIHGEPNGDGTFTISRTAQGCTYWPDLPLVYCNGLGGGTTGGDTPSDDELLCECGCSPDYPL